MKSLSLTLCAAIIAVLPVAALAQSSAGATLNANLRVRVASSSVRASAGAGASLSTEISRADTEIDARISALNDLASRVSSMKHLSASVSSGISASIQTQVSDLTNLKAKIDADTDQATLKTDMQSIVKSYRIYALVLPQAHIAAMSDRVMTISGMFSTEAGKILDRLSQMQGDTTSLQTTLSDYQGKVSDAQTQAQAAVSATASLQVDNGDKTVFQSNIAALKQARTDLQTAQKDLKAARADLSTLVKGIEANGNASANVSATTSTQ